MRLFLMRHGETPWNRRHRCQGVSDVPLSATGRAQAASLAAALAEEPLAAVYSSPLARAAETARAVAAPHGLPVVTHRDLRELDHGACEGLTPRELRERFGDVLDAWRRGPADVLLPGGESMRGLEARAVAVLREIAARHAPDAAVAIVAHNLVILALLARALGWPLDRFRDLRQDTAAISVLDVAASAEARVVTINETAHLGYLARDTRPVDAGTVPPVLDAPQLFGDLDAPFTYCVLPGLAATGAPRLAWRGVAGRAPDAPREGRAARRFAEAAGLPLVEPPPLADPRPALRLLADAEAAGLGLALAARLATLRFAEGRDLANRRLLVETAAALGLPAERAAAAVDPATAVGAAAEARIEADAAEAVARRVIGLPAALGPRQARIGAALLALSRRLLRPARPVAARLAGLLVLAALAGGCGGTKGLLAGLTPSRPATVSTTEAFEETSVARVAVLDLEPVAGRREDAAVLADVVRATLRARPGLSVASEADVAEALEGEVGTRPPLEQVRPVAGAVGADAVVTGRVLRFVEREGTALAARRPASVELTLDLRRGTDGALLWRGRFDHAQQALSESLADAGIFFRGGARWLTARELARLGIESLLAELPLPSAPSAAR